jgi:hypothetical protein
VTSITDDALGMTTGDYPIYSTYQDYIALGTVRTYHAYSKDTMSLGDYYSANYRSYGLTDDNSGKPYRVSHSIDTSSASARVIGSADGSSLDSYLDGLTFNEEPTVWAGGTNTSPTAYGYLSDGSILNRNYALYRIETIQGVDCYSTSVAFANTTDPNDGKYYYVELTWSQPSGSGWKILLDTDGDYVYETGHQESTAGTTGTYVDYDGAQFIGDAAVTPTGIYPSCALFEKAGGTGKTAHFTLQGTDSISRFEMLNSSGAIQSTIKSNSSGLNLTSSGFSVFSGVTPAARATTGITAASFTANTSGIADDSATFGGYTIGQIVAALKAYGLLT